MSLDVISESLVPSREEHLNPLVSLDFDGLLESPIQIHQDAKEGCGGRLWPAGMLLSQYLLVKHRKTMAHKTMLVYPLLSVQ